jgi:hypothetical protein
MRVLTAGVLALVLAGPALAAPAPQGPPPPPRVFLSPSGEPFRLSPQTPDPLKAWFDQADANHDGVIDKAEFRADAVAFFKKLDENGDGVIDGFETADYEAKVVPELGLEAEGRFTADPSADHGGRGEHGGGRGDGYGGHGQGGGGKPPLDRRAQAIGQLLGEPEPISGADFNFDSHVTLAEWMSATDQRFELLDAAHSGKLTLDELRTKLNGPPKR